MDQAIFCISNRVCPVLSRCNINLSISGYKSWMLLNLLGCQLWEGWLVVMTVSKIKTLSVSAAMI
jgi:hypothetical protein